MIDAKIEVLSGEVFCCGHLYPRDPQPGDPHCHCECHQMGWAHLYTCRNDWGSIPFAPRDEYYRSMYLPEGVTK